MNEVRVCLANGGSDSYHHGSGVCLTLIMVRIALNMLEFNHQSVLDKCYRGHVRMFEGLFKAALKKIRHVSGNACFLSSQGKLCDKSYTSVIDKTESKL